MIESGKLPVAVIHAPISPRRTISECIALLPEDTTAVMDADFAKDIMQLSRAIANRLNRPLARDTNNGHAP